MATEPKSFTAFCNKSELQNGLAFQINCHPKSDLEKILEQIIESVGVARSLLKRQPEKGLGVDIDLTLHQPFGRRRKFQFADNVGIIGDILTQPFPRNDGDLVDVTLTFPPAFFLCHVAGKEEN